MLPESDRVFIGLMAHIHLDQVAPYSLIQIFLHCFFHISLKIWNLTLIYSCWQLGLEGLGCKLDDICRKCRDAIHSYGKKRKNLSPRLKKILMHFRLVLLKMLFLEFLDNIFQLIRLYL